MISTATAALASLLLAPTHPTIIQGQPVRPTEALSKFTVALRISSQPQVASTCSGVLIADNLVLTAGHCVGAGDQVAFGTDLTATGGRSRITRPIDASRAHPQFQGGGTPHDLGLIRFSGGLPTGYVPMTHLVTAEEMRDGDWLIIAGYGANRVSANGEGVGSGILRRAKTRLLHRDFSESEVELDETSGFGPCYGDSGGPALQFSSEGTLRLLAVASRGEGPHCTEAAIYTRVDSHLDWIRSVANEWGVKR